MMYRLLVDYGKPFTEEFQNKESLKNRLVELRDYVDTEDVPYCDIYVHDSEDNDITDDVFGEMEGL